MALKSVKKTPKQADTPVKQAQAESRPIRADLSEAERQKIAEAAYYRAQQRGFEPGYEIEDWLAAEAEVKKNGLARLD